MSIQRVKEETTAGELVIWVEFLKREQLNKLSREKLDYYLAQIACETRRSYIKHPDRIKPTDFLLDFEKYKREPKKVTKEQRTKEAKSFWLSAFGIKE